MCLIVGRDSSVGIATRYGLDGPGTETRWWARFSAPVQTGPGAHPAYSTVGISRPHLAPRLKKQYSYTSTPPLGLHGLYLYRRFGWEDRTPSPGSLAWRQGRIVSPKLSSVLDFNSFGVKVHNSPNSNFVHHCQNPTEQKRSWLHLRRHQDIYKVRLNKVTKIAVTLVCVSVDIGTENFLHNPKVINVTTWLILFECGA
jgi:hypothetical protein